MTDFNELDNTMEFSRSILEGVEIKRCRNNPHSYKAHVHNELSLGFIMEGSTDLTLNDKTLLFGAGDGVIIPPLMTHRCAPTEPSRWAYVMLYIDPGYYGDAVCFNEAKKLSGIQARKLIDFIDQLLAEINPDALENLLIELLLEFGEKNAPDITADTGNAVRIIRDYIINHAQEEITLELLQQISGLNKFSLIRNFKKHYVTTPGSYHLQYRLAEAKRLLNKGTDVFDICDALRFYDQAHFIREFKKMYGVTPGAYVAQISGEHVTILYNTTT
jgi:AraC-like DNA-binding protein